MVAMFGGMFVMTLLAYSIMPLVPYVTRQRRPDGPVARGQGSLSPVSQRKRKLLAPLATVL